ncbi:DUF3108 domain-containing protein [Marinobacter sp. SS21]|uniref:DUF3108 domain-containing protein n=1 Tax=Marinobacter sp. SS21 TaxID=2979460 RepID=UPI00232CF4F3|nr:DUF3108 domain-containing protein [Marinobacter sp. SS21]MDC0663912.1 DUF3108 domain-containing protein [Marinobacter sp. SS21]
MPSKEYRPRIAPRIGGLIVLAVLTLSAYGQPQATPAADSQMPPPAPFSATFRASLDKGVAIDGTATRSLEQLDSGLWRYQFRVDSFIADIEESTIFRWENDHAVPLRYRYELSGMLIRDRERTINFDWSKGTASGHHEGKAFSLPLKSGALDPLSYQLQLHQDLRAGRTDVTYQVIDKGRYDEDRFAIIGEEQLQTRLGTAQTVKVEKVRNDDSKRETLMWFVPDWDHLMVRLTQTEPDGSFYEIHIEDSSLTP